MTSSIGVADITPERGGAEQLIAAADEALYASKNGGKDAVYAALPDGRIEEMKA